MGSREYHVESSLLGRESAGLSPTLSTGTPGLQAQPSPAGGLVPTESHRKEGWRWDRTGTLERWPGPLRLQPALALLISW